MGCVQIAPVVAGALILNARYLCLYKPCYISRRIGSAGVSAPAPPHGSWCQEARGGMYNEIKAVLGACHFSPVMQVGAGQMGSGIALVAAVKSQVDVLMTDVSEQQINSSVKFLEGLVCTIAVP